MVRQGWDGSARLGPARFGQARIGKAGAACMEIRSSVGKSVGGNSVIREKKRAGDIASGTHVFALGESQIIVENRQKIAINRPNIRKSFRINGRL
jgi:hypothetical protein